MNQSSNAIHVSLTHHESLVNDGTPVASREVTYLLFFFLVREDKLPFFLGTNDRERGRRGDVTEGGGEGEREGKREGGREGGREVIGGEKGERLRETVN